MRDLIRNPKCIMVGLLVLGVGPGCGASRGAKPVADSAPVFIRADIARVTSKCDQALEICRYSVLPDLRESQAGQLSMLGVIFTPSDPLEASGMVQSLFGFQVSSMKVRYRECQALKIHVDGTPLPRKALKYHQAMGKSQVVEGVTVELSINELQRISYAAEVRCDLCGDERKLRGDEKMLLAHLYETWRKR